MGSGRRRLSLMVISTILDDLVAPYIVLSPTESQLKSYMANMPIIDIGKVMEGFDVLARGVN